MSEKSMQDAIKDELDMLESSSYGVVRKGPLKKEVLKELGITFYKAKEQFNYIRFIPPKQDVPGFFGMKLFVHYGVGPNGDAFLCPKMMKREYCPLCEKREELQAQEDEVDPDVFRKYNWSLRYLFWVVDVANEETETKGVQVYVAPKSMIKDMISLCVDARNNSVIDVSDPEDGQTFIFKRSGKTMHNTTYGGLRFQDDKPLLPEWCKVPAFEEILNHVDANEIRESMLDYVVDSEDLEPASEEKKTAGRSRSRSREENPVTETNPEPVEEEPKKEPKSRSRSRTTTKEEKPAGRSRSRETTRPETTESESLDDIGKKSMDRLARLKEDENK